MRRFLLVWVSLSLVLLVGTALVSYFLFKRVDLRLVALVQVLAVPAFQAVVLLWVSGGWSVAAFLDVVREARGRVAVLALLALDLGVLGLGWALWSRSPVGFSAARSLQPLWMGAKTLAAAVGAGALALRASRPVKERIWLGIVSLAVLAFAAEPYRHWLDGLADRGVVLTLPTVLRWLIVYGGLYVLVMVALVHTGTVLRARSRLGGFFIDAALALGFVVGVVTVPSIFLKPYLVEPWASIVRTCVSLAATFLLAAFLSALSERTHSVA